eukprot:sb/3464569/
MGVSGLLIGLTAFVKTFCQKLPEKSGAFVNQIFVLAISLGDIFTPCYILILTVLHWTTNEDFCDKRLEWMSGRSCNFIGVLNTVGATISSLAMACISVYRLYGTRRALNYRQSGGVTKELRQKVSLCLVFIVAIALAFALVPLSGALEDWFVNGLVFPRDIALFLDAVDKTQFLQIVYGYYGARYTERSQRKADISWSTIHGIVAEMFSADYGTVSAAVPGTEQRKSKRLGRKVTLVCVTDFCCWLPFLICCALHTADVVDMSSWYQVFSLNILPINSVLNPLLYSDVLNKVIDEVRPIMGKILTTSSSWRSIFASLRGEPVEPEPADQMPVNNSHLDQDTIDEIPCIVRTRHEIPTDMPEEQFEVAEFCNFHGEGMFQLDINEEVSKHKHTTNHHSVISVNGCQSIGLTLFLFLSAHGAGKLGSNFNYIFSGRFYSNSLKRKRCGYGGKQSH